MKKPDSFWRDGISIQDFEKLSLGSLLIVVVLVICFKFVTREITSPDMIYLSGVLAGAFVARKAFKYAYDKKQKGDDPTI